MKRALVKFATLICDVPHSVAQSEPTQRETVRAGPATLQVLCAISIKKRKRRFAPVPAPKSGSL